MTNLPAFRLPSWSSGLLAGRFRPQGHLHIVVKKKSPPLGAPLFPPLLSQFHRPLPVVIVFRYEAALHLLQSRRNITAEKGGLAAVHDPEDLMPRAMRAGDPVPDITIQHAVAVEEYDLRRSLQTFELSGQIRSGAFCIGIFQLAPLYVIAGIGKRHPAACYVACYAACYVACSAACSAVRANPAGMILMEMA